MEDINGHAPKPMHYKCKKLIRYFFTLGQFLWHRLCGEENIETHVAYLRSELLAPRQQQRSIFTDKDKLNNGSVLTKNYMFFNECNRCLDDPYSTHIITMTTIDPGSQIITCVGSFMVLTCDCFRV